MCQKLIQMPLRSTCMQNKLSWYKPWMVVFKKFSRKKLFWHAGLICALYLRMCPKGGVKKTCILWHTPRNSIRSSPIRPNFQMTTFKAKNVFLVFNMVHTMNKLTYEYKKTQFYNNLVDLQCKCMRLDTPRIGPIWGFSAVI